MPYKLILNRGPEEIVQEFETMEAAFDAAQPPITDGYIARVADKEGVVQYTQVLQKGLVATYRGDMTTASLPTNRNGGTHLTDQSESDDESKLKPKPKPWWKFS